MPSPAGRWICDQYLASLIGIPRRDYAGQQSAATVGRVVNHCRHARQSASSSLQRLVGAFFVGEGLFGGLLEVGGIIHGFDPFVRQRPRRRVSIAEV